MKLLKEVEEFIKKDTRSPQEQMAYIKQLGMMMMLSPRLYRDHVVAFCGSLAGLYEKLNSEEKDESSSS